MWFFTLPWEFYHAHESIAVGVSIRPFFGVFLVFWWSLVLACICPCSESSSSIYLFQLFLGYEFWRIWFAFVCWVSSLYRVSNFFFCLFGVLISLVSIPILTYSISIFRRYLFHGYKCYLRECDIWMHVYSGLFQVLINYTLVLFISETCFVH